MTSDRAGLRMVCGCRDFLRRMSGSQIDVSQVTVWGKKPPNSSCKQQWHFIQWLIFGGKGSIYLKREKKIFTASLI